MEMQGIASKLNGIPHFVDFNKMAEGCRSICAAIGMRYLQNAACANFAK